MSFSFFLCCSVLCIYMYAMISHKDRLSQKSDRLSQKSTCREQLALTLKEERLIPNHTDCDMGTGMDCQPAANRHTVTFIHSTA